MGSIAYVERRLQVGLVHNRIGLKPRWYLGAYSLLQMHIHQILEETCRDDIARYRRLTESLDKVLMFDVSLGIDAYHLDMIAQLETSLKTIEKSHETLEKTAGLDSLLGILNRKALMHAMEKEFSRAKRYKHPTAILFIDFDHFKAINDTHGHQFGDRVLQTATKMIRQTIREPDILARYGGEELVVVLVECGREDALKTAERIRRAIAGNVIQKRRTSTMAQVTVSIGVHFPNPERRRPATAMRYADKALYAAKKAGRNRVVVYGPGLSA